MNTGAPLPGKVILGENMQWSFRTPAFLSCPTEILPVTPDFQSLKNAFRTTQKDWKRSNGGKKKFKSGRILAVRKLGPDRPFICLITRVIN